MLCAFPLFFGALGPSIVQSPTAAALPAVVEKFEQEKIKSPWLDTKHTPLNQRQGFARLSSPELLWPRFAAGCCHPHPPCWGCPQGGWAGFKHPLTLTADL